jgi:predicted  nucleic acid-binding Zn-ribbon protein
MNANEDNVFCKGCSEVLTTFLREMADHNAEVVCPHCGKIYTRAEAEALAKSAGKAAKE